MSAKQPTPPALSMDELRFFDRHIPAMHGGDYTISVQQTVQSTSVVQRPAPLPQIKPLAKTQFPGAERLMQSVSVAAPRYALDPADVHAVFPPAGQVGSFDQNLASVTLVGGALPWERELTSTDNKTPYLAVLLVQEDELVRGETAYRASDILAPPARTMGPQITKADRQDKLGEVTAITVVNGGSGYNTAQIALNGGGGSGATASAVLASGVVTDITVIEGGSGYTAAPTIAISGGGSGFAAQALVTNGAVQSIAITQAGSGYDSSAKLTLKGGGGTDASADVTVQDGVIVGITMSAVGANYTSTPSVGISGDGTGASAQAARGVQGRAIDISTANFTAFMPRYDGDTHVEPRWLAHVREVPLGDKETKTATGTSEFGVVVGNRFPAPGPGPLASLVLETTGQGYTSAPEISITGGGGQGATAIATLTEDQVSSITITNPGSGYSSPPTVTFTGGGASTAATAIAQTRARWQAHLVSLEGWADYLGENPTWPNDPATGKQIENLRVVSLYSWSFFALSEAGDFQELVENLAVPAGQNGVTKDDLLLRLPDPGEADGSEAALSVQAAFKAGYTALEYQTRSGVDTFAWYRGPLTPLPVPPVAQTLAWDNAGSAMIYDQSTGLFDQSYSAGWQAGRLLGLSDPNFATQLRTWRRQGITLTNTLLARIRSIENSPLQKVLPSPDLTKDDEATVAELEKLLEADLLSDTVMKYLTESFMTKIAPQLGQADGEVILAEKAMKQLEAKTASPPPTNVVKALQGLLNQPAVAKLLSKMNGTDLGDPAPSALSYVVQWLGELRLMDGVPFAQMVPDTAALPVESLRFFYVDPNYQKALVDGALSVGIESGHEVLYQALNYDLLVDATAQEMLQTRAKLLGQSPPNPASETGTPLAGLLIRSSIVAGWPGLEIKGYRTSKIPTDGSVPKDKEIPVSSDPMLPLRLELLAPDVMLVIFPDVPAWVSIGEPHEQLAFGHEDDGFIDLRWLSKNQNSDTGQIIGSAKVDVTAYYRDKNVPSPVLNTTALSAALSAALQAAYKPTPLPDFDAGAFAIQMVRAPEQMIFQNQPASASVAAKTR